MTLHLDSAVVARLCEQGVAMEAAQLALDGQRSGDYRLPPRIDLDVPSGFLRVMPAALGPYAGVKVMTLAREVGNRYLLLVYEQGTGELLATLDAAEVTRLRTAATTALAARLVRPAGVTTLALVGSGFEAAGHLRAFAALWPLQKVYVHSSSVQRRTEFARRYGAELGLDLEPVDTVAAAVGASPVSVLCTKSTTPVVEGGLFPRGATVLSIGSTRPDLRELDVATFSRARAVLVDDPVQVLAESGDVRAAVVAGAITSTDLVSMADWPGSPARRSPAGT
jgi:ornithine cyclodeaminase/alanine dehydrogenase